jgi:hypothetical protein
MTKARDLAGFASSSVTTTASDGLVLKGDGSSTDVVIKNGANATVATVADGTTTLAATANLTAGGSITATGASVGALAQGAIQVGNSSGVAAPLTIGSSAQLLQSNGTTAAWATISTGVDAVVFPNLASPNNTYTSSGTWSKGSLSDDAYVWIYLVGGGAGGKGDNDGGSIFAQGGYGGQAKLIYGKAKFFDGGTFVIGAGNAGNFSNNTSRNNSTFTLSSSNGGAVFTTTNASNNTVFSIVDGATVTQSTTLIEASPAPSISFLFGNPPTGWSGEVTGSPYVWSGGEGGEDSNGQNGIFGGGTGAGQKIGNNRQGGGSLYAGAGGTRAAQGTDGTYPGGGGGGSTTVGNVGGDGANGNMRVYHV